MTLNTLEWQDSTEKLFIRQLMEDFHADMKHFYFKGFKPLEARSLALDMMIVKARRANGFPNAA